MSRFDTYNELDRDGLLCALERHADTAPIDMDCVAAALRSLGRTLEHCYGEAFDSLRLVAVGMLLVVDELREDLKRPSVPRAEDGDIVFANRSFSPAGTAFGDVLSGLHTALTDACSQRASVVRSLVHASDLLPHDSMRDQREELH